MCGEGGEEAFWDRGRVDGGHLGGAGKRGVEGRAKIGICA